MLNYQRVDHFCGEPHEVLGYPCLYLVASPCGSQWHAQALLVDGSWRQKRLDDWHLGCEFIAKHPGEQSFHSCTSGKMMKNGSVPSWSAKKASFQWLSVRKLLLKWAQIQPTAAMDLMEAHRAARPGHWATSHAWPVQEGVSWRRLLPFWVGWF